MALSKNLGIVAIDEATAVFSVYTDNGGAIRVSIKHQGSGTDLELQVSGGQLVDAQGNVVTLTTFGGLSVNGGSISLAQFYTATKALVKDGIIFDGGVDS